MTRRAVGFGFVALAVFTFCCRYVCAALFGSNVNSWSAELFRAMLEYVGTPLSSLSKVLAVAGIAFLLWGERSRG